MPHFPRMDDKYRKMAFFFKSALYRWYRWYLSNDADIVTIFWIAMFYTWHSCYSWDYDSTTIFLNYRDTLTIILISHFQGKVLQYFTNIKECHDTLSMMQIIWRFFSEYCANNFTIKYYDTFAYNRISIYVIYHQQHNIMILCQNYWYHHPIRFAIQKVTILSIEYWYYSLYSTNDTDHTTTPMIPILRYRSYYDTLTAIPIASW